MDEREVLDFFELFRKQYSNQMKLMTDGKYNSFTNARNKFPVDDPRLCSYHVQQLMSEIGEVLESDKRWKNFRNEKYDKAGKLEEIADCFIVMMNITMFSGFGAHQLYDAIAAKIDTVEHRIDSSD